ncbi:hypothetical protein EJ04DRAFT_550905 [Polyplosphaeria fusca]|uniref:Uncharacterized protein n=1 Tax=Polyplosphaeria fusca TaxID=682080 RepID=A0A9P4R5L8_9PLEO|nr:hypothetical protein EJ04DRAFT_550905 [Polyplosphaeria fusca]
MLLPATLPLLAALAVLARAGNICYLPNGETNRDVPCNASAPASPCCSSTSACLSNGLCIIDADDDSGISYSRGTCTDRSWSSPLCPQMCQLNQDTPTNSSAYDFRAGGVQVWECGAEGYARDAEYCCESAGESTRCCSTTTALLTLASASVGAFTGSAIPTTTSFSSTTQTQSQDSASRTSAAATSGTSAQNSGDGGDDKGPIIGGVVGGVAALAVVVCGVFLWRWWKKGKAAPRGKELEAKEGDVQAEKTYYGSVANNTNAYPAELPGYQLAPQEMLVEERVHELRHR